MSFIIRLYLCKLLFLQSYRNKQILTQQSVGHDDSNNAIKIYDSKSRDRDPKPGHPAFDGTHIINQKSPS